MVLMDLAGARHAPSIQIHALGFRNGGIVRGLWVCGFSLGEEIEE
jgi:hypothetical protein